MTNDHTANSTRLDDPPIQLLIPVCLSADAGRDRYAWLHGYCLLTITPRANDVELDGEVRMGHRYAENPLVVKHLADALNTDCILAGFGLDDTISQLGRLPIDADQPAPALAVLHKLQAMIEARLPFDMGCDEDTRIVVHNQAVMHGLDLTDDSDQCNLEQLAATLADQAGACVLALNEFYLPDRLQPHLLAAWQRWRASHAPVLPMALTLVTSEGGDAA